MKILLGPPESGKTTVALHHTYNELTKLLDASPSGTQHHALVITSKKRLLENQLIFGIYCEVSIDTLKQVKLKYLEDYDSLVQFLADFHLLSTKPDLLVIDSLDCYLERGTSALSTGNVVTRAVRLAWLMELLRDVEGTVLKSSGATKDRRVMVTYRVGQEGATGMVQNEEIMRVNREMRKYSDEVYGVFRHAGLWEEYVLDGEDKLGQKSIEMYRVYEGETVDKASLDFKQCKETAFKNIITEMRENFKPEEAQ